MQVENQRNLFAVNPQIREYYAKEHRLDLRKLNEAKHQRTQRANNMYEEMHKIEAKFLKQHRRSIKESWASPVR
jgi:hypothetical protein